MRSLIKYNLKIIARINYFVGWVFLICIPIFCDFNFLNESEVIKISEYVFTIIGVIWFAGLFSYEKKYNVKDLVQQMPKYQKLIFIIRILFILFSMFSGFIILLTFAKMQNAVFDFEKILYSSMTNSFLLGMVALLFSQLTKEVVAGYMISFYYYYFEVITKGSFTKYFYLFGLVFDIPYNKILLMSVGIILLVINFILFKSDYSFKLKPIIVTKRLL